MSCLNLCEYCSETIYYEEDQKVFPDDLPDDIPQSDGWGTMYYHSWCFEEVVDEERREIAMKHGDG